MNQELISVISAFFGSLGFSIIYNIRGLRIWIPAIGGAVFWAVYLIFLHFINNEFLGFFFVAILITIYSEIWARILKTPSTVILMPTVIPLIPGGSLYYAMDAALRHDMPQFFSKAQAAVGLAVALAAGIMAVTSMQHLISALIKMIKPAPSPENYRKTFQKTILFIQKLFHNGYKHSRTFPKYIFIHIKLRIVVGNICSLGWV